MNFKFKVLIISAVILLFSLSAIFALPVQDEKYQALLGTWNVEVDAGGQIISMSFEFTLDEDTLQGMMLFEMGDGELEDIQFDGTELAFKVSIDVNGQVMSIDGNATIDGNSIEGTLSSEMGEAPFSGEKEEE